VGVLSPWVKTTVDRERCRNVKERVTVNKRKIIEKGNKKLNRFRGDDFSLVYERMGSKCTFRLW